MKDLEELATSKAHEAAAAETRHYRKLMEACSKLGLTLHVDAGKVKVRNAEGNFRGLDMPQQKRVVGGWNPFGAKVNEAH